MKKINSNDIQIIERLISLNQKQTKRTVSDFLKRKYSEVIETKDYIFAKGDIPIALVAHMDTVFETDKFRKKSELYYDERKSVMWYPGGAGFDDRAGVFAILKIIRDGYKPHVIFTTDEEIGGCGAYALTDDFQECPFEDVKYFIELDRANKADCVFYDCDNPKFTKYIEAFGFVEAIGSFSDIDIICSEWGIAGVNLSIGYQYEHTASEILIVNAMLSTIEKVKTMLEAIVDVEEPFIYIMSKYAFKHYYKNIYANKIDYEDYSMAYPYYDDMIVKCEKCGRIVSEYDAIPVRMLDGTTGYYCGNCISDKDLGWCKECNEAFERTPNMKKHICPECKELNEKWQTSKKSKNNSKK